jgi:RNA polymerase sigma-70 factor (ECF subfamily)
VTTTAAADDEAALVELAAGGDRSAFERLVIPYRPELHVHCYRMLGSLHDAEDLVQETLLRAWRGLGGFERRSSVRAWLYKIATNACLNQLRRRPRVVVPSAYQPADPGAPPAAAEVPWIEPYPDRLIRFAEPEPDPAERATQRLTTSLAFLTAVQLLTARQRAVLILRDVLAFSTAEVADLLETTAAAVDSALQRARRRLTVDVRHEPPALLSSADERLVQQFVSAWERTDIDGLVALLAADAVLVMPPMPAWFRGPAAIGQFLATVPADGQLERIRLVPTQANGQTTLAAYAPAPGNGRLQAYGLMVLTTNGESFTALTGFADPTLFPFFGLPAHLDPAT